MDFTAIPLELVFFEIVQYLPIKKRYGFYEKCKIIDPIRAVFISNVRRIEFNKKKYGGLEKQIREMLLDDYNFNQEIFIWRRTWKKRNWRGDPGMRFLRVYEKRTRMYLGSVYRPFRFYYDRYKYFMNIIETVIDYLKPVSNVLIMSINTMDRIKNGAGNIYRLDQYDRCNAEYLRPYISIVDNEIVFNI